MKSPACDKSNRLIDVLKHVPIQTIVFAAIEVEKGQQKLIAGIETFDPANLKHAKTQEKNTLPTKEGWY